MVVFTPLAVTHPSILTSTRSSRPHDLPSLQREALPYRTGGFIKGPIRSPSGEADQAKGKNLKRKAGFEPATFTRKRWYAFPTLVVGQGLSSDGPIWRMSAFCSCAMNTRNFTGNALVTLYQLSYFRILTLF